ncbi:MAG: hypothetical protein GY788_00300 [bacterium]|nr:hypothetical protein [bacterium]
MRRLLFAALAAAFTFITLVPANAGGSWLDPSWERVEAGDRILLSGFVSHGQLGWINDGPFYAYLSGATYGIITDTGHGGTATDVPLGQLGVEESERRLAVSIDFALADEVPPGEYWVLVCNDPCTTGLGDLIGGVLYIGMDPPPVEEEVTSVTPEIAVASIAAISKNGDPPPRRNTAYMALGPYPERPSQLSPLWIGFSVALVGGVLLIAFVGRQNSDS